jgi:hypothetical protein
VEQVCSWAKAQKFLVASLKLGKCVNAGFETRLETGFLLAFIATKWSIPALKPGFLGWLVKGGVPAICGS